MVGKTGIDLPNEQESLVPSTEWKMKRYGEKWYAGETISVSIGQGQVTVTPASLAVMISTVANGGTRVTPHVLKAIDEGQGWKPVPAPAVADAVAFKPDTLAALREGLWMVVNASGTGGRARLPGYDVAGKTGTAQVISNQGRQAAKGSDRDLRDHGFFVFFAPRDNPQIAGVIFAEHGEHGYLGAPIAKHVIDTFFAKKEGRPLPRLPLPAPPAGDRRRSGFAAGAAGRGRRRRARRRARHPERRRPRPRDRLMFERRLHFHIDWAMLIAVAALCLLGLAKSTAPPAGRPTSTSRRSTASCSAWWRSPSASPSTTARSPTSRISSTAASSCSSSTSSSSASCAAGRGAGSISDRSTCSPRNSPRRRWRWCWPSSSPTAGAAALSRSDLLIAGAITTVPLVLIARQPDLGTAVTLVPVLFATAFRRGHADADLRHPRACRRARSRPWRGSSRSRTIRRNASPRSWTRRRTPRAPGTSRFRPASPSDRAGCGARVSRRARRVSCGSFRSRTTISSSRSWPKSTALPAWSSRSDSISSSSFARSRRPLWPKTAWARSSSWACWPASRSRSCTTSPCRPASRRSKGLTLPLMSYGGSSMIATLAGFGLILNVRMRRFTN